MDLKQPKLQYEDFCDGMRQIIEDGGVPYFHCDVCGSNTWMYEGTFERAYKQVWCKCGEERFLSVDYDADL